MEWFYHWYSKEMISMLVTDDGGTGPYKIYCILKYKSEKEAQRHIDILKHDAERENWIMKLFYDPTDIHGLPWIVYHWELRKS